LLDGVNRHILTVSEAVNAIDGCEVAVCTVMPRSNLHEALERRGVKAYALGFPHGHAPGIFRAFRRMMSDFRPDVIHCHVVSVVQRIYLSLAERKLPFVTTIHGICDHKARMSLRDRIELTIDRIFPLRIAAQCYISQGVMRRLVGKEDGGIIKEVSYNPIWFSDNVEKGFRLHDAIGVSHTTPVVGTACRIAWVKNPEAFTTVMCKVLTINEQAHAVVMGDGERDFIDKCIAIVDSYGVADRFHWLGYREDAPALIGDLSCYIMTSHSEGMPTTVLECFAGHSPVAMLEGDGGLRDLVEINDENNPMLIHRPYGDYDGLAAAIADLIGDEQKSRDMTEQAFKVGREHFDAKSVAAQLSGIYHRIAK